MYDHPPPTSSQSAPPLPIISSPSHTISVDVHTSFNTGFAPLVDAHFFDDLPIPSTCGLEADDSHPASPLYIDDADVLISLDCSNPNANANDCVVGNGGDERDNVVCLGVTEEDESGPVDRRTYPVSRPTPPQPIIHIVNDGDQSPSSENTVVAPWPPDESGLPGLWTTFGYLYPLNTDNFQCPGVTNHNICDHDLTLPSSSPEDCPHPPRSPLYVDVDDDEDCLICDHLPPTSSYSAVSAAAAASATHVVVDDGDCIVYDHPPPTSSHSAPSIPVISSASHTISVDDDTDFNTGHSPLVDAHLFDDLPIPSTCGFEAGDSNPTSPLYVDDAVFHDLISLGFSDDFLPSESCPTSL